MELYPAIDLMDGKCVRLSKGDFNARTEYDEDPISVAKGYQNAGAKWLHIVDLDGSRNPGERQFSTITTLISSTQLKIQIGGGVRSSVDVEALLTLGVERVIIGSLCVHSPELVLEILHRYGPERVVLALDVRGNFNTGFFVATAGWQTLSAERLEDVLERFKGLARHILCTDIEKDGMLEGPNVKLYQSQCAKFSDMKFQASGGVSSLDDLLALKRSGAAGAVIGKAFYEKHFTFNDALGAIR